MSQEVFSFVDGNNIRRLPDERKGMQRSRKFEDVN